MSKAPWKRRRNGPTAQEALLSLALPRSSADRPSTSRRFTSLPSVAPRTVPSERTTSTISGSGLFHSEIGWIPTSAPQPTEAIGCALVKISASGPMPTSRYCDQRPISCSTRLTSCAFSDPAGTPRRDWPITGARRSRIDCARPLSPLACSSITRSTMLSAKVTPAAFTACRSIGASRLRPRPASASSTEPRSVSPSAWASQFASPSISISPETVADNEVRSSSRPPRTRTGQGPPAASDQTRPTRIAWPASVGSTSLAASCICHSPGWGSQ